MIKSRVFIIFAFLLFIFLLTATAALKKTIITGESDEGFPPRGFADVATDYWAAKSIENLTKLHIMEGYRDTTFRPERKVTRAELAIILVKAKGIRAHSTDERFKDVRPTSFAASFITCVTTREYMIGYPDKTFRPNRVVTRAEAAQTLARAFGIKEKTEANMFPDVYKAYWAYPAIAACEKIGLFDYLEGRDFEPEAGLTRAEAAEIFSKLISGGD